MLKSYDLLDINSETIVEERVLEGCSIVVSNNYDNKDNIFIDNRKYTSYSYNSLNVSENSFKYNDLLLDSTSHLFYSGRNLEEYTSTNISINHSCSDIYENVTSMFVGSEEHNDDLVGKYSIDVYYCNNCIVNCLETEKTSVSFEDLMLDLEGNLSYKFQSLCVQNSEPLIKPFSYFSGVNYIEYTLISGKECNITLKSKMQYDDYNILSIDGLPSSLVFDSDTSKITGVPFVIGEFECTAIMDGATNVKLKLTIIPQSLNFGI